MDRTKKDYSISFVRLVATVFIVSCHVMQYYEMALAWWFNVGVQMFLFISGYLYGRKERIDTVSFYIKNCKKILLDYYIYALIIVCVILIAGQYQLGGLAILKFLSLNTFPKGLEHFWFIPCIIICYSLTPAIHAIIQKIDATDGIRYIAYSLFLLLVVDVVFQSFFNYTNSAWINCFVLGMILIRCEHKKVWKYVKKSIFALCVIMNGVQIYINYFADLRFEGLCYQIYAQWCKYAHVLLGISIILMLRWIYETVNTTNQFFHKVLDYSDLYSYDIYIVHQFFILGPHSLLSIHKSGFVGIAAAILLTVISAIVLRKMTDVCKKTIPFYDKRKTGSSSK